MNIRKFTLIFYLGILIVAVAFAATSQVTVQAQTAACDIPGTPPCTPTSVSSGGGGSGGNNGGGGTKKQPTPIPPPTRTSTPTYSPTPTNTPTISDFAWTQTAIMGVTNVSGTLCSYWLTVTPENVTNWYPCGTPTASMTPHVFIPPVAGPVHLKPGVINISVIVLIIIVCFGGGFFLLRRGFKPPSPNTPPGKNFDDTDHL